MAPDAGFPIADDALVGGDLAEPGWETRLADCSCRIEAQYWGYFVRNLHELADMQRLNALDDLLDRIGHDDGVDAR